MPIIATYRAPLVLERRYGEPCRAYTYKVGAQELSIWVQGLSNCEHAPRAALATWRVTLKRLWLDPCARRALLDVLEAHHHAYRP